MLTLFGRSGMHGQEGKGEYVSGHTLGSIGGVQHDAVKRVGNSRVYYIA